MAPSRPNSAAASKKTSTVAAPPTAASTAALVMEVTAPVAPTKGKGKGKASSAAASPAATSPATLPATLPATSPARPARAPRTKKAETGDAAAAVAPKTERPKSAPRAAKAPPEELTAKVITELLKDALSNIKKADGGIAAMTEEETKEHLSGFTAIAQKIFNAASKMRKAGGVANKKKRRGINGYFYYTQFKRNEIGANLSAEQKAQVDAYMAESATGKKLTEYFAIGKLIHHIYEALPQPEKDSYNTKVKAYNVYFMEDVPVTVPPKDKRSVVSWLKLSQKERDAYKSKADAAAAVTAAAVAAGPAGKAAK